MKIFTLPALPLFRSLGWTDDFHITHSKGLEDFLVDADKVSLGKCEARVGEKLFKGSSVEAVIKSCSDAGLSDKEGASSIRCSDFNKLCEARFAP